MAGAHAHPNYVKIWALLLVLLVVSIIGPELGIPWLTLVTAFGIALVKTYYVAAYFMHLNFEKKIRLVPTDNFYCFTRSILFWCCRRCDEG